METNWYDDHQNLHLAASHLAAEGTDVDLILDLLEKPWKFGDVFAEAQQQA